MATRHLPRASLRLCNLLQFSASELRCYSTQPTDRVAFEDTATSDGDRRDKDDRTYYSDYMRQYMADRREDPEFRAQENQKRRERYARDPAKQRQRAKEWVARKRATDPEWTLACRQKRVSRYFNPETHETSKEISRQHRRSRRAEDPTYNLKDYTRSWVKNYKWVRDDLDWTPWTPILYPGKVEHRCQERGAARHNGARHWFG